MNNNNYLWETILSDFKKTLPLEVIETWFMHSSIEKVDFVNRSITIISENQLISEYLKNIFDVQIKEILKKNTTIDFIIFYNYIGDNNKFLNNNSDSYSKPNAEEFINIDNFLSKDKPSGIQHFYKKQQSFVLEDYKEPVYNYNKPSLSKHNPSLKKHFTFDNFVIGKGNEHAYAVAQAVANYPGSHNPFFIYGGVGLGKTHLLHAIGNELEEQNPDFKIECVSSETFINEFINAIKENKKHKSSNLDEKFREKYRNVDALLIDDIQFLSDKTETQHAFFHTFNELQLNNKQIVLVSDRRPSQLDGLEDRLVSRFDSGVLADITPPDYETRTAIIKFKCEQAEIKIDDSVVSYISGNINGNIREIVGILQEIKLIVQNSNTEPTIAMAEEIIKRRVKNIKKKIEADDIINKVSKFLKISIDDIMSAKRNKEVVFARMIAIYLCKDMTDLSFPAIGKLFNKDHSSIFYANSKIASYVEENSNNVREIISSIKNDL